MTNKITKKKYLPRVEIDPEHIGSIMGYSNAKYTRTRLWIPHNNREIELAGPVRVTNLYTNEKAMESSFNSRYGLLGRQFLAKHQQVLTGDYAASLIYALLCMGASEKEPEFKYILESMIQHQHNLWVYNINIITPKGVYVLQDKSVIGDRCKVNIAELEKKLSGGKWISGVKFSEDNLVRFTPEGSYHLGTDLSARSLAEDGFIIASFGKEGAEKLSEVSRFLKSEVYINWVSCDYAGKNKDITQKASAIGIFKHGRTRYLWLSGGLSPLRHYDYLGNDIGLGSYGVVRGMK